ncbi:MAG TPA: ABC transporter substrate-binding protein, partial [Negativicutes bacterium]|nr:ABC transporter substrate-binding protein [Negativicutes bacterium]
CGGGSAKSGPDKPLVINLAGGDSGYPTPYGHYPRGPGIYKMQMIFDSLLERDEQGYIPWLAEKWDVSPDGKSYTFTLRTGVKWHDGKPLTAEDVKFSFEYFVKNPPVWDELNINGKSTIQTIELLDERTLKVTVDNPNATILGRLGNARIIPKHIWGKVDDPQKFITPEAAIGCGPYVLKEYNKEQGAYRFEAFKDYWGPKSLAEIVQFIPVSDGVLAFNKGEIDLTAISPDLLSKYEHNPEFAVKKNPAFWGYRLIFNMEKCSVLKEKSVRQAFACAVNKGELVEKVARGAAVPGNAGYLPVDHLWYNPQVRQYDFNIEKARELLAGKKLSFTLLIANANDEVRIAELLKISLAQAGIELTIKSVDGKTRDAAARTGEYELILNGHGGWGGDADLLRTAYVSEPASGLSYGIPGYFNEQINVLAAEQLAQTDQNRRKALVFRLQELIAEEIPQIPLYNTTGYIVYRPAKYNGWRYMFDHHEVTHSKLSYLENI